jgi:cytochrome c-type biogenesis protein CcmF
MIQEKRGMLKSWNMFLMILTFALVILGTFATRSGIVASVHSFAESDIAVPMLMFLGLVMVGCLALWGWRAQRGDLRADHTIDSLLSRESMFVLNNWLFVGVTVMVLWGTYWPTFSELFTGTAVTLGAAYYQAVVIPLFGAIYVLMGVAPLVAWKKASLSALGKASRLPLALTIGAVVAMYALGTRSAGAWFSYGLIFFAGFVTLHEYYKGIAARMSRGETLPPALVRLFARSQRRYGGYFIHLAVVVIGIGVVASTVYQTQTQETILPGERITAGETGMSMVYERAYQAQADDGRTMIMADVSIYRGDQKVADIRPRKDFFGERAQPMTIAGQYSTLESDFYVLLTNHEGERLTFRVYHNPLVNLIWWGGILLIVGTLLAGWPNPAREHAARMAEAKPSARLQVAGD